jgi:poly(A) polymerase
MKKIIKTELKFDSKNLEYLLTILNNNAESRVIGGAIRDSLLDIKKTDIDIATQMLPSQVIAVLNKANIRNIPTGILHGTITAFIESESFEITTLRKDIECYGRNAKVEFTDSFSEDSNRRDFTINALSYDFFNKIIYDYHSGYEDLKRSAVLFIGDPEERIQEDFLRILRYFRFTSNYSEVFDINALKACEKFASNIEKLSKERINIELKKIIDSKKYLQTIQLMIDTKIINYIFEDVIISLNYIQKLEKNDLEIIEKLFLLLYDNSIDRIYKILKKLRFSNKEIIQIKEIKSFIDHVKKYDLDFSIKYYKLSNNKYINSFLKIVPFILDIDYNIQLIEYYNNILIPKLPIDGIDLKEAGLIGNNISINLESIKHDWIKSNFSITKIDIINNLKLTNKT